MALALSEDGLSNGCGATVRTHSFDVWSHPHRLQAST